MAQEGHCLPGDRRYRLPGCRYACFRSAHVVSWCRGGALWAQTRHTCNAGAFGQFASGIGNTDAGFILGTGKLLIKVSPGCCPAGCSNNDGGPADTRKSQVPATLRFVLDGEMPPYLMAKDLILQIIGDIGVAGATLQVRGHLLLPACAA